MPEGGTSTTSSSPTVYVMAERYRGLTSGTKREPTREKVVYVSLPMPNATGGVTRAEPSSVQTANASTEHSSVVVGGSTSKRKFVLLLTAFVLLIGIVGGGWYVLYGRTTPSTVVTKSSTVNLSQTPVVVSEPKPVSKPEPTPTPVPEPAPVSPFATVLRSGPDSDSDGLSDLEETDVYRTDPHRPDTDGDGFLDGNEVFHRYSPERPQPSTLLESGLVVERTFGPEEKSFHVLIPTSWKTNVQGRSDIRVAIPTSETIDIAVLSSLPEAASTFRTSKTKNGFTSHISNDQLEAYLDVGGSIIYFKYNAGAKGTIDYLQTFQMMLNSL